MTEEVDEDAGLRGALLREYFRERRERGLEYKNDYPEGSEDWKLARLAEEIRRRWDRELFFWAIYKLRERSGALRVYVGQAVRRACGYKDDTHLCRKIWPGPYACPEDAMKGRVFEDKEGHLGDLARSQHADPSTPTPVNLLKRTIQEEGPDAFEVQLVAGGSGPRWKCRIEADRAEILAMENETRQGRSLLNSQKGGQNTPFTTMNSAWEQAKKELAVEEKRAKVKNLLHVPQTIAAKAMKVSRTKLRRLYPDLVMSWPKHPPSYYREYIVSKLAAYPTVPEAADAAGLPEKLFVDWAQDSLGFCECPPPSWYMECPRKPRAPNWTDEEDATLIKLRKEGRRWVEIARQLPGRSNKAVRYRCIALGQLKQEEKAQAKDEERQRCCHMCKATVTPRWRKVAGHDTCNACALKHKSKQDKEKAGAKQVKPRGVWTRKWTDEEDATLLKLHKKHGNRWAEIARQLPGRTEKQVRYRCNALVQLEEEEKAQAKDEERQRCCRKSKQATCKSKQAKEKAGAKQVKPRAPDWTDEEDATLRKFHEKLGNRWTEIARQLQGRTEVAARSRFLKLQGHPPKRRGTKRSSDGQPKQSSSPGSSPGTSTSFNQR